MLLTVKYPSSCSPLCFHLNPTRPRSSTSICRATLSVHRKPNISNPWDLHLSLFSTNNSNDGSVFDPLGINPDVSPGLNATWESLQGLSSQTFENSSGAKKDRASSAHWVAAAIEDSSIDYGDFFKGQLPGKFLKLLGYLALSRLGIYIPLGGVNREAFVGNLDQNSLLSTLDSFSGGGIGRLGICSLGIVPFINLHNFIPSCKTFRKEKVKQEERKYFNIPDMLLLGLP